VAGNIVRGASETTAGAAGGSVKIIGGAVKGFAGAIEKVGKAYVPVAFIRPSFLPAEHYFQTPYDGGNLTCEGLFVTLCTRLSNNIPNGPSLFAARQKLPFRVHR
jgi:hypothetical protein